MHPALTQDETFAQQLYRICNPPTPATDAICELRKQWQAEEEAHREVVFQDSHDKYWEARCASHDDGDEGEAA